MIQVRLLRLPVPVHVASSAHIEALQREFDVLSSSEDHDSVPRRLLDLVAELQERYGGLTDEPASELRAAIERGDQSIDLTYAVPPDTAEACVQLDAILDEVDDYCRQGEHLLTLAAPPEPVAYRRWYLREFIAQINGAPPTPWEEFADRPEAEVDRHGAEAARREDEPETELSHSIPPGWSVEEHDDRVIVRPSGELDLQSAPELRDLVLLAAREHTAVVELDLAHVSFIDSVGLSMVVSAHQRLAAQGARLVVVIPPSLERLFEISGLGQLLELRT